MPPFKIISDLKARGDQVQAIDALATGLRDGLRDQTLLGVTGSGKTFTMASVIEKIQKPTLVLVHNKTLAAQLATEFQEFFPKNSVEFFVSYYDYYQPEAYVPASDTYIEKESDINDQIDKMRHAATRALLTRRDVIIVASVSCIYGLGSPEEYMSFVINVEKGDSRGLTKIIRRLVDMQYERNDYDMARGRFRVRGDSLEILPSYDELAIRIQFWGDEIEKIVVLDPLTGEIVGERDNVAIYPAKHFVTSEERIKQAAVGIEDELAHRLQEFRGNGKLLEAQRLQSRTLYDVEMLKETGYCSGVENYSRHLAGRQPGSTPWTLMDYLPDDFLLFVDESHMTLPQVRGMYRGDFARKSTLVEYGFRLPSAIDNRPLNFNEFEQRINQVIYVSATPGPYEADKEQQRVEQVIRPTGLLDPTVDVRKTSGQVDDLLNEINERVKDQGRVLVTTLTKRMAEELSDYLKEMGVRTHYLHSEINTLERTEILRDLRLGVYDVVVGINLLREGLDLPEVSLVVILDADKEGYLRSNTSLVQTMGRAARHDAGHVIMYADSITASMRKAIDETQRRRSIQDEFNRANGIVPASIVKDVKDITDRIRINVSDKAPYPPDIAAKRKLPKDELLRLAKDLESQMKKAASDLEFEKAAMLRDQIMDLRKVMAEGP